MIDTITQIGAAVFGILFLWLLSLKNQHVARWGWIAAAVSQPFFLISYIRNGQWGFIVLWCWYMISICNGIRNHFMGSKCES